MANQLSKFFQNFQSGSDRFTTTTGRFFSVVFSFPDNARDLSGLGAVGSVISSGVDVVTNIASDFLGGGSDILQGGLNLLSREIGLKENNMQRYPMEDIHWLVKGINLPNMKLADGETLINSGSGAFGTYVIPGMGTIEPESNTFSIDLIPTVESPIENFFVPWMEEVMSMNVTADVPFRRANIFVHVYNENLFNRNSKLGGVGDLLSDVGNLFTEVNTKYTYKLTGAYPTYVDTPNLSHEGAMDTRVVGFAFNKIEMYGNPIMNGALNALGGVGNILGTGISGAQVIQGGRGIADAVKKFTPGGSLS